MRLEGYDKQELWKSKLSLRGKKSIDRRSSSTKLLQYINTFLLIYKWFLIMDVDQYKADPWGKWINMATIIQHRSMQTRFKLGHSYKTYNVDICQMDANLSTTTTVQMWIHARIYKKYSIATWGKQWALGKYPSSSSCLPQSTILSMWLQVQGK